MFITLFNTQRKQRVAFNTHTILSHSEQRKQRVPSNTHNVLSHNNRGSERQSVSHPASGCLRGKDQTQEGRDPQGTDPHRGRPHRGRPTHTGSDPHKGRDPHRRHTDTINIHVYISLSRGISYVSHRIVSPLHSRVSIVIILRLVMHEQALVSL